MSIFMSSDYHLDHQNVIKYDNRPDKDIGAMNARIIDTTNEYVTENDWFVYLGDLLMNKQIGLDDNEAYVARVKYFLDQLRCKNIVFCGGNHDRIWIEREGIVRPNWAFWKLFQTRYECELCHTIWSPTGTFGSPRTCKKGHNRNSRKTEDCHGRNDVYQSNPIYDIHPMGYELKLTGKICADHQIPHEFKGMRIVATHYSHRVWNKSHKKEEGSPIGKSINLAGHSHGSLPGLRNQIDVGFNIWNRPLSLFEILTKLMPEHNATNPEYVSHHNDERN